MTDYSDDDNDFEDTEAFKLIGTLTLTLVRRLHFFWTPIRLESLCCK